MISNVAAKKVLVRVDFNVPLDSQRVITDDTRILKAIPTIKQLLDNGAAVILMSHLGRPLKKLNDDGSINKEKFSLRHVKSHLGKLLNVDIQFADDCINDEAILKARDLKPGEVLLLENTRFHQGEKSGDIDMAAKLASLADVYVNDAFGAAHRAHASTVTVAKFFKPANRSLGLLMENEIASAKKVLNSPKRPCTAILGGAKVSDKIQLIEKLLDFANKIIIGGGMSYTFIKAQGGDIGDSLVEEDYLDLAKELLQKAKNNNVDFFLPEDSVLADSFSATANSKITASNEIPNGWMGLDIGPKAIEEYTKEILASQTILWNGPLGVFEFDAFANGTNIVAQAVAQATSKGAYTLIGGGDSVAAINKAGLADQVSFVSTGGGAMLEFLEGKKLPGIKAIESQEYIENPLKT